jgi:hypothetical protein
MAQILEVYLLILRVLRVFTNNKVFILIPVHHSIFSLCHTKYKALLELMLL